MISRLETTVELHDLGELQKEWSGILSPLYDEKFVQQYIHGQFLEDAASYVNLYQDTAYWKQLLQRAQEFFCLEHADRLTILDIGSGGGNTLFPLFELYPNADFIASDLSIPLLKVLKDHYEESYKDRRCLIVQLNAEEIVFEKDQMDLVVGGAILHHLFEPRRALSECYRVLKPGGWAIFFEPFEIGNQILALVFRHLVEMNGRLFLKRKRIDGRVVRFLRAICKEFSIRKGIDKTDPVFKGVDEKWLFTKSYFCTVARSIGFRDLTIFPIHSTDGQFLNQTKTLLRLGLGTDEGSLPRWAVDYICEVDDHFSKELRRELIIEGGIVLHK